MPIIFDSTLSPRSLVPGPRSPRSLRADSDSSGPVHGLESGLERPRAASSGLGCPISVPYKHPL